MTAWEIAGHMLGGLAVSYAAIGVMALALRLMPPPAPPVRRLPEPEHPLDVLDEMLSGGGREPRGDRRHSPEASARSGRLAAGESERATQEEIS